MSFDIITTVSPNLASGIPLFLPSWFRNSGAKHILVRSTDSESWYENIIHRNKHIQERVKAGRRIVSLDLDCFVVKNLARGFDGIHPISVARWPGANMGVAFFDGQLRCPIVDWDAFFKPLMNAITMRCRNPKHWDRPGQKGRFGDQPPWQEALQAVERDVGKLDMNVWNFCHQPEDWEAALRTHHQSVRVIHIKGRGAWHLDRYQNKINLVRELFPDAIKE